MRKKFEKIVFIQILTILVVTLDDILELLPADKKSKLFDATVI